MSELEQMSLPASPKDLNAYVESQYEELFANVQILNAIEFPIVRVNIDGTMRFANNAFLEATEVEFADLESLHQKNDEYRDRICLMQFDGFIAQEDLDVYSQLKNQGRDNYENRAKNTFKIGATEDITFISAKGNATPFRMTVTFSGKYDAYQVNLVDVSDLKQAEAELSLANSEMEERVREQTEQIKEQAESILEMSTPVIKLWDRILFMPLIGTIDTQRARQMSDEFLRVVGEDEINVTIIDVTGVPVIDTSVVRHLVDTVNAAKFRR